MDAVHALSLLGGVASVDRLLRYISRKQLRTATARGCVRQLRRGLYGLPDADRALVRAAELGGMCSHLSAAVQHGWEVAQRPDRPWITVPLGTDVAGRRGCRVFWADLADERGLVTSPGRTVLDCARRLDPAAALAVADSALRHGDVDVEDQCRRAADLHGKGVTQARVVLARASPLAANPFESVLRGIALDAGLDVIPQMEIRLGDATVRPDLVDAGRRLVIEADSWEWHAGRDAHARDVTRYTALTVGRWRVLRFAYDEVMLRPDEVLAILVDIAHQRPHTDH